jgi:protein-S-isoprenylcysteine O-methyltransferase Ste14
MGEDQAPPDQKPGIGEQLGRVLLVSLFGGFGGYGLYQSVSGIAEAGLSWASLGEAAPEIGKRIFMLAIAIAALTRRRRVAVAAGVYPRVLALLGTFFAPLAQIVLDRAGLMPTGPRPLIVSIAAPLLILAGSVGSFYVLLWLRRSFSIMPEARKLVTGGPYAWVRHPLYVTEELIALGFFVTFPIPWMLLLLVLHVALQIRRMDFEERVLTRAFPDYADYAKRTARVVPGVY